MLHGKDKLGDFVERFWHYDLITRQSETEFVEHYKIWAKEKKYHQSQSKAIAIYALAREGIPTLSSVTPSAKMLVTEAVRVLQEIDATLGMILAQMREIAKSLPEYAIVRNMGGVGDVLAPKLIAEIGDVRRFHNGKALIAYAGIDTPPYESGNFVGSNRHITKRGSSGLRKVGYETMRCITSHPNELDPVYCFIMKKESEGKSKKVAKIAELFQNVSDITFQLIINYFSSILWCITRCLHPHSRWVMVSNVCTLRSRSQQAKAHTEKSHPLNCKCDTFVNISVVQIFFISHF